MIEIKNKAGEVIYIHDDVTLRNADLRWANLSGANLRGEDLSGANLCSATLYAAILCNANLSGAQMQVANLRYTNLRGALLRDTDLRFAHLSDAQMPGVDLSDANLLNADLCNTDLSGAKLPDFQIPQDIDLTVWGKKSKVLVEMKVPQSARRTSCLINRKCRAEFVDVIKVHNRTGKVVVVNEYGETTYEDGKRVHPHDYCDDIRIDCAPGIHFWLTKEEAEAW